MHVLPAMVAVHICACHPLPAEHVDVDEATSYIQTGQLAIQVLNNLSYHYYNKSFTIFELLHCTILSARTSSSIYLFAAKMNQINVYL